MPARASSERRIYPRHRVRVAVLWKNRRPEAMPGEICDLSAQGLFLVSTTAIPDDVSVGDSTEIAIPTEHGEEVLRGIVRWRGFHPAHQAIGCGIQLDEPSCQAIVRIFPILLRSLPTRGAESISTSAPSPFGTKNRATS